MWLLLSCGLSLPSGCQSSRSFYMDSNSRSPWFGLNLSLPKPSARRKTLQTISDAKSDEPTVSTAELRTLQPPQVPTKKPVKSVLPKWLGGETAQSVPDDAPRLDPDKIVELQGPREEFR
ncbi:MAG: hypothetical protein ACK5Q5_02625 [Planctomycetaceae bacterium]